jgi:hypothetical protein
VNDYEIDKILGDGIDELHKRITELEAEAKASNLAFDIVQQKYEVLRDAAQAVVDGLFLAVPGDYHYSQQDTDLIDALKTALEVSDEHRR